LKEGIFAALSLIVLGILILVTWYGILSPIGSASIMLCFFGAFIAASRHDFLGRFWGGVIIAAGIAVFIAFRAGVSAGIAVLLIGVGLTYVLVNAVQPKQ